MKSRLWKGRSVKPEPMTFVHFTMCLLISIILSSAKNLSERPFVALGVTTPVCPVLEGRFSQTVPHLQGVW